MMEWLKVHGVSMQQYENLTREQRTDYFPIGVFAERDEPDFNTQYEMVRKQRLAEITG